ncbi:MAG: antibiotic biosynthesis monooxygenase [Halioglobus sp.]|nr:antibiotic biosynthesis monooxygenase [Halioglobus sp.]
MKHAITLMASSDITPGKFSEFKLLLEELVKHCEDTEPGTLAYNYYLNLEETELLSVETFENSDAVIFHALNYSSFAEKISELVTMRKITVCGNCTQQLLDVLAEYDLDVLHFADGFARVAK